MRFLFGRSAMLCLAALFLLGLLLETGFAAKEPSRPRILGIADVTIAAPSDTEGFYVKKLGITAASQECMGTCLSHLDLSSFQQLEILDREQFDGLTQKPTGSNIVQITFETSDLQALRTYLASLGIRCSEISKAGMVGANSLFWVVDPNFIKSASYSQRDQITTSAAEAKLAHISSTPASSCAIARRWSTSTKIFWDFALIGMAA